MRGLLFLLGVGLLPWSVRAEMSRPAKVEVRTVVQDLGAESYSRRERAQDRLTEWSDRFPRFMLGLLAGQYRESDDVEVTVRLRELLKPLAMTYLFNGARGFIGVNMDQRRLESGDLGVSLQVVHPGKPASRAGLRAGDVIVSVEGSTISELGGMTGFSDTIAAAAPGSLLELGVRRKDETFTVRLQPVLWPADIARPDNTLEARERRFNDWLRDLRPRAVENGIPVGHYPREEEE